MDSVEGEVAPTKEDTNAGTKEDTKKNSSHPPSNSADTQSSGGSSSAAPSEAVVAAPSTASVANTTSTASKRTSNWDWLSTNLNLVNESFDTESLEAIDQKSRENKLKHATTVEIIHEVDEVDEDLLLQQEESKRNAKNVTTNRQTMKFAMLRKAQEHSSGGRHGFQMLIKKHIRELNRRGAGGSIKGGGLNQQAGSSSSGSETSERSKRNVNQGPTPLSHSSQHTDNKGYIDSVIRSLLYDDHRGGAGMLSQIVDDIESNVNPQDWSLFRSQKTGLLKIKTQQKLMVTQSWVTEADVDEATLSKHMLDNIKMEYPEAARRVAISIISNSVEGVTFDRFRYDTRSIALTKLINDKRYHYGMIGIALLHCFLGFVEQSLYFDPYATTISYLSPLVSLPLEIVLVLFYLIDCCLCLHTARQPSFTNHPWLMLKIILSVLFVVDIVLGYVYMRSVNITYYEGRNLTWANLAPTNNVSDFIVTTVNPNLVLLPALENLKLATWFRISRWLRPLLFIESTKALRKEIGSIIHVIQALLPVLFLIAVWILGFSMLAVIFFPRKEIAAMAKINPTTGNLYFSDLYAAAITWLSVFFGAVIWPNVTLPAMIEQNAVYVLLFLFFALGSLVVWTNLLTAVVFQSYNERSESDALDVYMQAHVGCELFRLVWFVVVVVVVVFGLLCFACLLLSDIMIFFFY